MNKKISKFVESKRKDVKKVADAYPHDGKSLIVDYDELEKYDLKVAEELLANPDEILDMFNAAMESLGIQAPIPDARFRVRFTNLPKDCQTKIKYIASEHIGKMISAEGIINRISDVLPKVNIGNFVCGKCGEVHMVLQTKRALTEPLKCKNCERREFRFDPEKSKFIDVQRLEIQESLEMLKGGEEARKIEVWVEEDMTDRATAGEKVIVNGILRLMPPKVKGPVYYKFLDANHIAPVEKEFEDIDITDEEIEGIKSLGNDPKIYEKVINSIAPSVWGHREVKESIALQLFGGRSGKKLADGTHVRSDIHLLLIGDPGVAKSRILQYVDQIAPKSIYVSGKGTTGAGLTATAERDEFAEGAWTLKAGALVLAGGGIACIDEFDKMDKDDRSAMHEAMEQQSYHPNTPLMLADGTETKIGTFVEELMGKNSGKVIDGKNCHILPVENKKINVFTSDFGKIYETCVNRVSRHTAPDNFINIRLQNGREVIVTPEHPCWVIKDGGIATKRADELTTDDFLPVPAKIPFEGETQTLNSSFKRGGNKSIRFPEHTSPQFCRFLGYLIGDGSYELNRGVRNGINFYNKNPELIEDFGGLMKNMFSLEGYYQPQKGKSRTPSVRYVSKDMVTFLDGLDSRLLVEGKRIRIPPRIMKSRLNDVSELLKALFESDGHMTKGKCARVGFVSESRELAHQVQTILLRFGIYSTIFEETLKSKNIVYRTSITGHENISRFSEHVGFISDKKNKRLAQYLKGNVTYRTLTDLIPNCGRMVSKIAKTLKLHESKIAGESLTCHKNDNTRLTRKVMKRIVGEFEDKINKIEGVLEHLENKKNSLKSLIALRKSLNFSQQQVSDRAGVIRQTVSCWERYGADNANLGRYCAALRGICEDSLAVKKDVGMLKKLAFGDVLWANVTKVEKIPNDGVEWVYDVTVEPNQTFVSGNMILHNTISVAKAGIIAKFKANTSVLAASNPKFSRFDVYKPLGEQFDVPPTLLSRFDLIFPIRDVLDSEQDRKIAQHILKMHKGEKEMKEITPDIEVDLFRKYISYARTNVSPVLTDDAAKKIEDYYVDLRARSAGGSVTATARQLEALIRLAEASAKMRLSNTATVSDVERAVNLTNFVLREIATDETGRLDIDRIVTDHPKSTRDKIVSIEDIIRDVASKSQDKLASIEDVKSEAYGKNIDKSDFERIINELRNKGIIAEVKGGKLRWIE